MEKKNENETETALDYAMAFYRECNVEIGGSPNNGPFWISGTGRSITGNQL